MHILIYVIRDLQSKKYKHICQWKGKKLKFWKRIRKESSKCNLEINYDFLTIKNG